jgi:hypothetical protein
VEPSCARLIGSHLPKLLPDSSGVAYRYETIEDASLMAYVYWFYCIKVKHPQQHRRYTVNLFSLAVNYDDVEDYQNNAGYGDVFRDR